MARTVDLSILGLLNWDSTVLDLFQIPSELDRETLIDNIIAETCELEVLYTNPTVMKNLVGIWSKKQLPIWEKLLATTKYEYNPIENYNRMEDGTDTGSGTHTTSGTDTVTNHNTLTLGGSDVVNGDSTTVDSGEDNRTNHVERNDDTERSNLHKIAAYDADELVDQNSDTGLDSELENIETTDKIEYGKQEDNDYSRTTNYGRTETENGSSSTAYGKTDTETNNGTHTLHAHGNIGVTTTQKLIREQREIEEFNIYDYIANEFKLRFCILIY